MKRNKFKRTSNDQQTDQPENQIAEDESYDDAISRATADYYERCWKDRIKDRKLDIWIAVGVYLVLCAVAFVVL